MAGGPHPLVFPPGVNVMATPGLLEAGWSQSSLIRFKNGLLQKLGGSTALNTQPFVGVCRGVGCWSDLTGIGYIAVGTTERLQVLAQGVLSDITPAVRTASLSAPFTTTAGSSVVSVADSGSSAVAGDWINIENAAYVDGLFLQGFYQVLGTIAGGYQFDAGAKAIAGVSGGGAALSFTTTTSSHTVTVTLGAYTFTSGQNLLAWFATAVGGTTVGPANYAISVSGGTATIQVPIAATSGATVSENGGDISIAYLLPTAVESGTGTAAFGNGPFGLGPFGVASGAPPFGGWLRQWSMDNWGEDLIAGPVSGEMFTWTPPPAIGNVATPVTNAPLQNTGFFTVQPVQQIIAYGCTDPNTNEQDPMLLRWCDEGNNTDWTATATNQAGSYRLTSGNQIVGGLAFNLIALIWTDIDFWLGQYLGFPLVWGFNKVGTNVGLFARRAMCAINTLVWWLGQDNFYLYDGSSVQPVPCDVWDFIFDNLDKSNPGAITMAPDPMFNEWFCFFPTQGSAGQVTSYVKCNFDNPGKPLWDYGPIGALERSAWSAQSPFGQPVGTDYNGYIQQQESATDNNGMAYDSWAVSGWIALGEGIETQVMKWFWPDLILTGGNVQITLFFADYLPQGANPSTPIRTYGPYTITPGTEYIYVNGRGRYFAMKIESTALGVFWRLGRCRAVIQPDGKGP